MSLKKEINVHNYMDYFILPSKDYNLFVKEFNLNMDLLSNMDYIINMDLIFNKDLIFDKDENINFYFIIYVYRDYH